MDRQQFGDSLRAELGVIADGPVEFRARLPALHRLMESMPAYQLPPDLAALWARLLTELQVSRSAEPGPGGEYSYSFSEREAREFSGLVVEFSVALEGRI